jgi:transposase
MPRLNMKKLLPAGLVIEQVGFDRRQIEISAKAAKSWAACPACGTRSGRVHSRYRRRLADLPAQGFDVRLMVQVRRFRCGSGTCCRAIFSERLDPGLTRPHARRTARLQGLIRHLALALGGRPAQALGRRLLLSVSKDTFLRSLAHSDGGGMAAARVIGIDDWAWRKGQRYGTLICDLEQRRVIDLLPDREPATVEAWLRAHPGVEVIARDRNGGYGSAIAKALPEAVQVADRWHLLENASAAFLSAVQSSLPAIRRAIGNTRLDPKLLTAAERLQYEGFRRRQQTNEMIRHMAKDSTPIKQIVRRTGLSRKLVRQILRGEREDVFRIRESSLTPWLARLETEWSGVCRNGAELWRRLKGDGFRGSLRVVGEWATRQRRAEKASPIGVGKSPPARRIARLLTTGRDHLSKADSVLVAQIEAALPALAQARVLADQFTSMVRNRSADQLGAWLAEAEGSLLSAFAQGLRKDQAAVSAALSERWSNGQTEGRINRLKLLKRQMYGRAGIALLKARITAIAYRSSADVIKSESEPSFAHPADQADRSSRGIGQSGS